MNKNAIPFLKQMNFYKFYLYILWRLCNFLGEKGKGQGKA